MGDFFRSTKFKILVALLVVLIAFMFVTAYLGGRASPPSQILGAITAPIQKLSSSISGAAVGFFEKFLHAEKISEENEALREEMRGLREKLADFEKMKQENEHYKQYLDLKEENPTFTFAPAQVIGRDPNERFFSFTIDKGTLNGVSPNDPVITPDGLVGKVSEAGLSYSKVTTILDVAVDVGAIDSRTRDIGVVTGDVKLAGQGLCKMGYLSRESTVAAEDIVLTSGLGGVFPKGLLVGTVGEVRTEVNGITLYATVMPAASIKNVKDVFVITSFSGQGIDTPAPEETSSQPAAEEGAPQQGASGGGTPAQEGGESAGSATAGVPPAGGGTSQAGGETSQATDGAPQAGGTPAAESGSGADGGAGPEQGGQA